MADEITAADAAAAAAAADAVAVNAVAVAVAVDATVVDTASVDVDVDVAIVTPTATDTTATIDAAVDGSTAVNVDSLCYINNTIATSTDTHVDTNSTTTIDNATTTTAAACHITYMNDENDDLKHVSSSSRDVVNDIDVCNGNEYVSSDEHTTCIAMEDVSTKNTVMMDTNHRTTILPPPAPSVLPTWLMCTTDEGRAYYVNVATQKTTWERPDDCVGAVVLPLPPTVTISSATAAPIVTNRESNIDAEDIETSSDVMCSLIRNGNDAISDVTADDKEVIKNARKAERESERLLKKRRFDNEKEKKKTITEVERIEKKRLLEEEKEAKKAALEAERAEKKRLLEEEKEAKKAALEVERAERAEKKRVLEKEKEAKKAALEAERAEKKRLMEEEKEAKRVAFEAERAERAEKKRLVEEEKEVKRSALEAERSAKKRKADEEKYQKEEKRRRSEDLRKKQASRFMNFFQKDGLSSCSGGDMDGTSVTGNCLDISVASTSVSAAVSSNTMTGSVRMNYFRPIEFSEHTTVAPMHHRPIIDAEELERRLTTPGCYLTDELPRVIAANRCNYYTRKAGPTLKMISFSENHRPPYWGTYQKVSSIIGPRRPLAKDENMLDYEIDSDDEWEEEEEGESVAGTDDEDDKEEDAEEEDDDGFIVPHGYLSDGEGNGDDDAPAFGVSATETNLQKRAVATSVEHLTPLVPVSIGPIWSHISSSRLSHAVVQMRHELKAQYGAISMNISKVVHENDNSGELDSAEATSKMKRQSTLEFSAEELTHLVSLIHGRVGVVPALIELFRERHGSDISKIRLTKKISSIATHQKGRRDPWIVNQDTLDSVGFSRDHTQGIFEANLSKSEHMTKLKKKKCSPSIVPAIASSVNNSPNSSTTDKRLSCSSEKSAKKTSKQSSPLLNSFVKTKKTHEDSALLKAPLRALVEQQQPEVVRK